MCATCLAHHTILQLAFIIPEILAISPLLHHFTVPKHQHHSITIKAQNQKYLQLLKNSSEHVGRKEHKIYNSNILDSWKTFLTDDYDWQARNKWLLNSHALITTLDNSAWYLPRSIKGHFKGLEDYYWEEFQKLVTHKTLKTGNYVLDSSYMPVLYS